MSSNKHGRKGTRSHDERKIDNTPVAVGESRDTATGGKPREQHRRGDGVVGTLDGALHGCEVRDASLMS